MSDPSTDSTDSLFTKTDWITKVEYTLIALLTFIFLGFSVVDIFYPGIPSLTFSKLAFVIALLGALAATKQGRHLGLHILPFVKNKTLRRSIATINGIVFFLVMLLLCYSIAGASRDDLMSFQTFGKYSQAHLGETSLLEKYNLEVLTPFLFSVFLVLIITLMAIRAASWSFKSLELKHDTNQLTLWKKLVFLFLTLLSIFVGLGVIYIALFSQMDFNELCKALHLSNKSSMAPFIKYIHEKALFIFKKSEMLMNLMTSKRDLLLDQSLKQVKISGLSNWLWIKLPWILSGVCFLSLFSGTPVFIFLAALATIISIYTSSPMLSVMNDFSSISQNKQISLLFLFILLGYLLNFGKGAERLMRLWRATFGWIPASEAIATILVCAILASITGGSGATILILGSFFYKRLIKQGYTEGFAAGLITTAGGLGLLIPPSIPILLYPFAGDPSKLPASEKIFMGGLLPGAILILLIIAYSTYQSIRQQVKTSPFILKEFLQSAWIAKWDFLLPILTVGLFLSGKALMNQAAACAIIYSILLEVVIHKTLHPIKHLPKVFLEAMAMIGAIFMIFGMSKALETALVQLEISAKIATWVTTTNPPKWLFLIGINALLLIVGSAIEMYGAMALFAMFIAPLASLFNPAIDPVHMAVIFFCNMELGFLLPPLGLNLLLSSLRLNRPISTIYRDVLPFLFILGIGLFFITYIEPVTTWIFKFFP